MQHVTAYEVAQPESDPFHWHHLLEAKVSRLRELCAEADTSETDVVWFSAVTDEFEEFAEALVAHFEAEESLRQFNDLLQAHPNLKDRIDELIGDHRSMILLLEQVRDSILASAARQKISVELQRLLQAFAAHEETENEIVRAAYGDDPDKE